MSIEYVKQIIIDELKSFQNDLENKDSKWPLESYYDMYYNPNEGPSSRGNSDDCYNDGYNMGIKDGNIETLEKVLEMLQEVK